MNDKIQRSTSTTKASEQRRIHPRKDILSDHSHFGPNHLHTRTSKKGSDVSAPNKNRTKDLQSHKLHS